MDHPRRPVHGPKRRPRSGHASREHHELTAQARILVSNMLQPNWYRRSAGQLYLQT
jgi:hypothetical protein